MSIVCAAVTGALATSSGTAGAAAAQAGADLTRLIRLMTVIKAAMAAAVGATLWRLGWPVSVMRFAVYTVAGATAVVTRSRSMRSAAGEVSALSAVAPS